MFRPNPDLAKELSEDPEISEGLAREAESARALAETYANRIMPRAGASRAIEVVQTDEGVFLVNTDHGGHLDEFGSAKNAPNAPLRRGALGAGLRLEESPK